MLATLSLTEVQQDRLMIVRVLRDKGWTRRRIADALSLSPKTVTRRLGELRRLEDERQRRRDDD